MTGPASTGNQAIVHVVDDDEALRASLQWLLDGAGLRARTYAMGETFLEELDALDEPAAGCGLVDLCLPGCSGLELIGRLRERGVGLPIIMMTGHGDVPAAVRAIKAGAVDFIEKPFDEQYLLARISEALRSGMSRCRRAANRSELRRRFESLSPRERQVMIMVVHGQLNKQIAGELGLSPKTVEVHRAHVMDKMRASNCAELVRMALALEQLDVDISLDEPTPHSG